MENVRILPDGEAVSVDGTHLGHNLPDYKGNRHLVRKPVGCKQLNPGLNFRADFRSINSTRWAPDPNHKLGGITPINGRK